MVVEVLGAEGLEEVSEDAGSVVEALEGALEVEASEGALEAEESAAASVAVVEEEAEEDKSKHLG